MAVQLVSDEVHVTTGEPWRRWLDDGTRKRIREVDHACGWEAAAMEPGDLRKRGGVQPPRRRASRAVAGRLGRPVRRARMSRRAGFPNNARWASHG
jgi:hypothetical protein